MLDGMADAVGFGFFDIDRSLVFGEPPGNGTIVAGHFHGDRIARAYQARGFSENTQGAVSVWCGPEGCDSGLKLNLGDRNPANPFGGQFGRAEPLAVLSDQLLADLGVL